MSDERTAMAATKTPNGEMVTPSNQQKMESWGFGPGKGQYICTIDESTPEGRIASFKARQGQGKKLDEFFNLELHVVGYLISPIDLADDESGELVRLPLTRILLADGEMVQTTSRTVAETLLSYSSSIRPAPWNPPAVFKPRKQGTRSGGQFYSLEPTFSEFAKVENKKGK